MRERLIELLEPVVRGLGYELWELEYAARRGNGFLRLYIDVPASSRAQVDIKADVEGESQGGINLDDCEKVSRAVSAVLDEVDPIPVEYTLEVSSPGMDRVLRTAAHFAQFVGERVNVEMVLPVNGRRRFLGNLLSANQHELALEQDGVPVTLSIAGIARAHVAPVF